MLLRPADMAQGQRGLATRACSLSLSLVWARTGAFQPLPRSCRVSMTATCINARCDSTRHDNSHVYPRPLLRPSSLFEIQALGRLGFVSGPTQAACRTLYVG